MSEARAGLPDRWLVTGGCGFIGSVLVRHLLERGVSCVRILDDLSRGRIEALEVDRVRELRVSAVPGDWSSGVDVLVGKIQDPDRVKDAVAGASVVVHLAANAGVVQSIDDPVADMEANVRGTLNILNEARLAGVERVVIASSAAAVGAADPPVSERTVPRPTSPYGASKLASEAYASAFAHSFDLSTVALRFGNVYGPYSASKDSVVARFIKQWIEGAAWVIDGDGSQTRDFVYLPDLIDAVIRAGTAPRASGQTFQIATSHETSVSELAAAIAAEIDSRGLKPPIVVHGDPREGDVARNFSDTSLARELLGWEAATSLTSGISETLDWYLAKQSLPRTSV